MIYSAAIFILFKNDQILLPENKLLNFNNEPRKHFISFRDVYELNQFLDKYQTVGLSFLIKARILGIVV
jgi:hypothetical protein